MDDRYGTRLRVHQRAELQMIGTILLIVLILLVLGALPNWNHSRNWGYAPSGALAAVLVILLVLLLSGRI